MTNEDRIKTEEEGYISGRLGVWGAECCPYPEGSEQRTFWIRGSHAGWNAKIYWDSQMNNASSPFVTGYVITNVREQHMPDSSTSHRFRYIANVCLRLATGSHLNTTAETGGYGYGLWIGSLPLYGLGQFFAYTIEEFEIRLKAILDKFCEV